MGNWSPRGKGLNIPPSSSDEDSNPDDKIVEVSTSSKESEDHYFDGPKITTECPAIPFVTFDEELVKLWIERVQQYQELQIGDRIQILK